jgi:hypothetical protein
MSGKAEQAQCAQAMGRLCWQWLPTPRVTYNLTVDDTDVLLWSPHDVSAEIDNAPPDGQAPPPTQNLTQLDGPYGNQTRGDATGMTRLVFQVPNMPAIVSDWLDSGAGQWRGRIVLKSLVWQVVLDARQDRDDVSSKLHTTGGYGVMYVGELTRVNPGVLTTDEADYALSALHACLSFAFGRHITPALTVGYNSNEALAWEVWRVFRIAPWSGAETVIDTRVGASDLSGLFGGFATLWQDDFTRDLLARAVYYYLESNDPMPLELAVASSQSGLELLAWEELVEEKKSLTVKKYKDNSAADNMRELLSSYHVDVSVPGRQTQLSAAAARLSCNDGPEILTRMRNGAMHPSRKKPRFSQDEWVQSWCLVRRYIILAILGRAGHQGAFRDPVSDNKPQAASCAFRGRLSRPLPPPSHRQAARRL